MMIIMGRLATAKMIYYECLQIYVSVGDLVTTYIDIVFLAVTLYNLVVQFIMIGSIRHDVT
jgi:hypothetical protein